MLAIVDRRICIEAMNMLSLNFEVLLFGTENITYDAIACHPDIFFCMAGKEIIVAPNCPSYFPAMLKEHGINFLTGEMPVGPEYPQTARYNAMITAKYLVHNTAVTDKTILNTSGLRSRIHVNQAYTRCNLIHIGNDYFITSDRGIENVLKRQNLDVLFINPEGISLPGFSHGFFGGCCGFTVNQLFVNGNLDYLAEAETTRNFIHRAGAVVIELHNGPLLDIGSIMFV